MKKNYQNILIIFVCTVIIMLPLFLNSYKSNHDTRFHVANILSLKEAIIENGIDSKILPNIAHNFGYGTRLFYPPLSHTVVAVTSIIFDKINLDFFFSLKSVHFIVMFLSGVILYLLSLRLSKDKKIALVSSIIYMALPYHLSDIYVRDALGETFMFVFLPLILLGLTYLFENKRLFYILFSIGYVGGMFSHFTLMIYFTLFLIPFFVINIKKVFTKNNIIILIISAFTILLITSPFLDTMIEHKLFGDYTVYIPGHMAGGIWHLGLIPYDYINIFARFETYEIKFSLDLLTLIFIFLTFKNRKKIEILKDYKFIYIFGLISLYLSTVLFPWNILPGFLRMIQFPWRLVTFVAIPISLMAPLFLKIEKYSKIKYILPIIIFGLLTLGYLNINHASDEVVTLNNFNYSDGMGWQKEYLPTNTYNNIDYFNNRTYDIIVKEGGSALITYDSMPNLNFTTLEKSVVELPRLYYLGYSLKDSNNKSINFYENEFGFIEANLEKGEYKLSYKGTPAYNIFKKISLITIIISIIISWKGFIIWKKLV